MNVLYTAFASELVKVAASDSVSGYPAAVAAVAPAAIARASIDVPKGMVDKYVEQTVAGVPKAQRAIGLGRGAGRALGGVAGIATFPIFLSGMKDIKDAKDGKQKKRGYAKVIGASLAYGAAKGGLETAVDFKSLSRADLTKRIKRVAGTRAVLGAGAGALTAGAISKGLKKQEKKPDKAQRILLPAAAGAGIGAGKGALEAVATAKSFKSVATPKGLRGIAGKAAGRGAAGAIGAVALSEIARHAFKTKTAEAPAYQKTNLGPKPGEIYTNVRSWAHRQPDEALLTQYDAMRKRGKPEATPSRRAVYYAFHDELDKRGHKTAPTKMREKTHVPVTKAPTMVDTAAMAAIAFAPAAVWKLGIINLEADAKDKVLSNALDRMIAGKGIARMEAGLDFWGAGPSFTEPAQAYYLQTGDEYGNVLARQAKAAKTPAGEQYLRQFEEGKRHFISAPKHAKPELLAHELGHATAGALRRKTIASGLSQFAYKASAMPSIILPLLAIEGMSDKSFATADELEARAKFSKSVGAVAVLLQSPYLAEEATASIKGMAYMRQAGASSKRAFFKSLKILAPAFATYAASTATPFIVSSYLKRKANKAREQSKEKTAADSVALKKAIKYTLKNRPSKEHVRSWSRHAALNLGQAKRMAKDRKPADVLENVAYAAMPPTHHTKRDMAEMLGARHRDWFKWGANPDPRAPSPLAKKASTKMRALEAGIGAVAGGGTGYYLKRDEEEDEREGSVILGTALGAAGMAGASGLIRHFRTAGPLKKIRGQLAKAEEPVKQHSLDVRGFGGRLDEIDRTKIRLDAIDKKWAPHKQSEAVNLGDVYNELSHEIRSMHPKLQDYMRHYTQTRDQVAQVAKLKERISAVSKNVDKKFMGIV